MKYGARVCVYCECTRPAKTGLTVRAPSEFPKSNQASMTNRRCGPNRYNPFARLPLAMRQRAAEKETEQIPRQPLPGIHRPVQDARPQNGNRSSLVEKFEMTRQKTNDRRCRRAGDPHEFCNSRLSLKIKWSVVPKPRCETLFVVWLGVGSK